MGPAWWPAVDQQFCNVQTSLIDRFNFFYPHLVTYKIHLNQYQFMANYFMRKGGTQTAILTPYWSHRNLLSLTPLGKWPLFNDATSCANTANLVIAHFFLPHPQINTNYSLFHQVSTFTSSGGYGSPVLRHFVLCVAISPNNTTQPVSSLPREPVWNINSDFIMEIISVWW